MAAYLNAALAEDDPEVFLLPLRDALGFRLSVELKAAG